MGENKDGLLEMYAELVDELKREISEIKIVQTQHIIILKNLQELPSTIGELKETLIKIDINMTSFKDDLEKEIEKNNEKFHLLERKINKQSEKTQIDIIELIKDYAIYIIIAIYFILTQSGIL